jgi:hypothetical protein
MKHNCKTCKERCDYRGKIIDGFSIICEEECVKLISEEAKEICNDSDFIQLLDTLRKSNFTSRPARILLNRLEEMIVIGNSTPLFK